MDDLVIIPARRGSKRIKGKNTINLGGKPLISYTLEFALQIKKFFNFEIVVSSDCPLVFDINKEFGFDFIERDPDLSNDTSKTVDVCIDAIDKIEDLKERNFLNVHLLQPTNPFRQLNDFNKIIDIFKKENSLVSVFSLVKEESSHPAYMYFLDKKNQLEPFLGERFLTGTRAQDLPNAYRRDGSFYSTRIQSIRKTKNFLPDLKRTKFIEISPENAVNIDTYSDLHFAKYICSKQK